MYKQRRSGGYFLSLAVEKQHLIQLDGNFFIKLWKSLVFTRRSHTIQQACMFVCVFSFFVCLLFIRVWLQVGDLFYFTSALSFYFLPFLLFSL